MVAGVSECSVLSLILNEPRVPDGPVWWPGRRVSLSLMFGCPQSTVLPCKAPYEGILWGRPKVRVSPQEAGRRDPKAVWQVEGRTEVRALGRGSVGPKVLVQLSFKIRRWLRSPCPFSHTE